MKADGWFYCLKEGTHAVKIHSEGMVGSIF